MRKGSIRTRWYTEVGRGIYKCQTSNLLITKNSEPKFRNSEINPKNSIPEK